jgi:integration host factor subunit alpha
MVKADIIRSIEVQLGLSHEEATIQVEQILSLIKNQLTNGDSVLISGFGQWKVRNKKSRIGRNPKTLEEFEVTLRRVVTFYSSNVWREEISNNSTPK